ncbi:hypothetical protein RvY_17496 [Ramazzottius varieornatus]|uniref:Uncharacterized protein n=1 Tax=Ramazzottius varieornatus TaxID=947166 RepID=A0A1D1W2A6_RAMVA|nr:hypothetical protein RvY_17496 [Ramazzottius varieornatus]
MEKMLYPLHCIQTSWHRKIVFGVPRYENDCAAPAGKEAD